MGNATRTYAFAPTRLVRTVVVERLRATCVELGMVFDAEPLAATWIDPIGEIDFQIRGASELFLETSDTFQPTTSAQSFRRFVELAVRLCERLGSEKIRSNQELFGNDGFSYSIYHHHVAILFTGEQIPQRFKKGY